MPTQGQLDALRLRQVDEAKALLDEMATVLATTDALEQMVFALGAITARAHRLGWVHAYERLRVALDVAVDTPVTIILWPVAEACPEQPHAHLRFSVDAPGPDATPMPPGDDRIH